MNDLLPSDYEYKLIDLIHRIKRIDISSIFSIDVSMPEYSVMLSISKTLKTKNTVFVSDVVKQFGVSAQAVSKHLKICEKNNLIIRESDKNDRRNTKLFLTEYGKKVIVRCNKEIHDLFTSVLNEFNSDEIDSILDIAEKLYTVTAIKIDELSSSKTPIQ